MNLNKTTGIVDLNSTTSTYTISTWSDPKRVAVEEVGETIEMVYKETSLMQLAIYPTPPPATRVFKIIYSCIDGKWNKSERVYGEIVPAQNEYYNFD